MPKFEFCKITRPIDLAQYAPEYAGAVVQMWVNAPRAVIAEWGELRAAVVTMVGKMQTEDGDDPAIQAQRGDRFVELNGRMNAWWSTMWSQADDPETHWTADDVDQLVNHLTDIDPQAWAWLISTCLETVQAYRSGERKN
jgi:hypothetical protein